MSRAGTSRVAKATKARKAAKKGPSPNPRAVERANANARFKRTSSPSKKTTRSSIAKRFYGH